MPDPIFHELRVAEVIVETDDARSIVFDVPAESAAKFAYRPGQFLTLRIPSDETGSVARCYSLSSSPHTDDKPKVTVKRTRDGYGSNWINDNLAPGTVVHALAPGGVFSPKSLAENLLLFAGGSGITPVMSIVKSALCQGTGRVVLVYANRDERSVIFADELTALAAEHPDRLVVVHWLESVQGLPSTAQLAALARPFSDHEAFVCGPAPFMDAVTAALADLGMPRNRVHVEKFLSLVKNPFRSLDKRQPEPEPEEPETTGDGRTATVQVTLDGEEHTVPWPAEKRLLDVLLERGLDAPYSCREGRCSACACRKLSGEVKLLHNEVLEEEDLQEGYMLACQAVPVTDDVRVTYD